MKTKDVLVCMRCGSRDVSALSHYNKWLNKDGAIMGVYSCRECGFQGRPVIFDSESERQRYVRERKK